MLVEVVVGGIVLVLALGFFPTGRGTAAAINSVEDPHRQETPAEKQQANSDLKTLFALLLVVVVLTFSYGLLGAKP